MDCIQDLIDASVCAQFFPGNSAEHENKDRN